MVFDAEKNASSTTLVSRSVPEVSLIQRTLWILNILYHQILFAYSILLIWLFFDNGDTSTLHFWHLLLTTAAYVPLMAAAIILFSEDNLATIYIQRTRRYWIHGIILLVSCIFVTVGISVEYHDKEMSNRDHFKTDHAILGLVSWILIFVAVATGFLAANTRIFSHFIKPVVLKCFHNFLGIAGFAIGMGSLYLKMNYVQRYTSESVYTGSKWALWFITIWSLLGAFRSLWNQLRGIFS